MSDDAVDIFELLRWHPFAASRVSNRRLIYIYIYIYACMFGSQENCLRPALRGEPRRLTTLSTGQGLSLLSHPLRIFSSFGVCSSLLAAMEQSAADFDLVTSRCQVNHMCVVHWVGLIFEQILHGLVRYACCDHVETRAPPYFPWLQASGETNT